MLLTLIRKVQQYYNYLSALPHKVKDIIKCNTLRWDISGFHKLNSVALVRERTIPTERPPPVGEVSANFCG